MVVSKLLCSLVATCVRTKCPPPVAALLNLYERLDLGLFRAGTQVVPTWPRELAPNPRRATASFPALLLPQFGLPGTPPYHPWVLLPRLRFLSSQERPEGQALPLQHLSEDLLHEVLLPQLLAQAARAAAPHRRRSPGRIRPSSVGPQPRLCSIDRDSSSRSSRASLHAAQPTRPQLDGPGSQRADRVRSLRRPSSSRRIFRSVSPLPSAPSPGSSTASIRRPTVAAVVARRPNCGDSEPGLNATITEDTRARLCARCRDSWD